MIDALITALQDAKRRRSAETPVGARYAALCKLLDETDLFDAELDHGSSSVVDSSGAGAPPALPTMLAPERPSFPSVADVQLPAVGLA